MHNGAVASENTMTRREAALALHAGTHRPEGRKDKAQAGLAINELAPVWAMVRLYDCFCNTPGYRTVGLAFVSDGSEVQILPGGPTRDVSISFIGL